MRAASSARGFTLIEVVIALSLLALIMLGLVSALSTFGRTASSMDQRFERGDEARLVGEFLRGTLERVSARTMMLTGDGALRPMFEGTSSELQWVGVMPARHGVGGLYHFRLFVAQDVSGPVLALQYLPYIGGNLMPDWGGAAMRDLVGGLRHLDIAYAGADEGEWFSQWLAEEEVPQLMRLSIDARDASWPDLVVRLRPTGGQGVSEVVIGGGMAR
jgi:general secretion pathway protein J